MIELASKREIAELRLQWEKEQEQRCTTPQKYVEKTSRGGQRYYKRVGTEEYTEERKSALQLIAENYKKSEEKRQAKRPSRKKLEEKAENERWDRIYEEKFEDKSYYAR